MQITKELLDQELAGVDQQVEQMKAQLGHLLGAQAAIKNMRIYLDKVEPDKSTISDENKVIQENDQAKLAIPLADIAVSVAGPGAVVEAIDDVSIDPVADKIINAQGKYE